MYERVSKFRLEFDAAQMKEVIVKLEACNLHAPGPRKIHKKNNMKTHRISVHFQNVIRVHNAAVHQE